MGLRASVVAAGFAGAFRVETNHIFEGEAMTTPGAWSDSRCSMYDLDASPDSLEERAPGAGWARARRREHSSWLLGTAYAQRTIFEHQFPRDCRRAKFLAMLHMRVAGLGCWVHLLAKAVEIAMRLGRVLVFLNATHDPHMFWHHHGLCEGAVSWDCWFLPITNCTPHGDIFRLRAVDLLRDENGHITQYSSVDAPRAFHAMLRRCSGIKRSMWFYWWHAQWAAFFVRFNGRTRHWLDVLRRMRLRLASRGPGSGPPAVGPLARLPPGSVAVHVRHGDKGMEMGTHPFPRYLAEAERLAGGDQDVPVLHWEAGRSARTFAFPRGAFAGRTMFVSTEDPAVIDEALGLPGLTERPWDVAFTLENRSNDRVLDLVLRKGAARATLESFLNLELAVEADAWVCTLRSNWCQLIDELRMTVGGKASFPYINIPTELTSESKNIGNSYVYW